MLPNHGVGTACSLYLIFFIWAQNRVVTGFLRLGCRNEYWKNKCFFWFHVHVVSIAVSVQTSYSPTSVFAPSRTWLHTYIFYSRFSFKIPCSFPDFWFSNFKRKSILSLFHFWFQQKTGKTARYPFFFLCLGLKKKKIIKFPVFWKHGILFMQWRFISNQWKESPVLELAPRTKRQKALKTEQLFIAAMTNKKNLKKRVTDCLIKSIKYKYEQLKLYPEFFNK